MARGDADLHEGFTAPGRIGRLSGLRHDHGRSRDAVCGRILLSCDVVQCSMGVVCGRPEVPKSSRALKSKIESKRKNYYPVLEDAFDDVDACESVPYSLSLPLWFRISAASSRTVLARSSLASSLSLMILLHDLYVQYWPTRETMLRIIARASSQLYSSSLYVVARTIWS